MRKITFLAVLIMASVGLLKSQTTFYTETFGTPTSEKGEVLSTHVWDTNVVTYTWTMDETTAPGTINVRSNKPSTYSGASGSGNLYFNANATNKFTITGNTTGFNDVKLSFGIFGKTAGDSKKMVVEYSIDGGNQYTGIAATEIAALTATAELWEVITTISIPTATSVKLRFSTPNLGEIRIDDVKLAGIPVSNHLSNPNYKYWSLVGKTLKFEEFAVSNIDLFNLTGIKVSSFKPAREIKLNINQGIYILKVDGKATKITIR